MAVTQRKDGRWACYYRIPAPDGKSRLKWEYFGHGAEGEQQARKRNDELNLRKRRPPLSRQDTTFFELARSYAGSRSFSENSKAIFQARMGANILPFFGNRQAMKITPQVVATYVEKRRKAVTDSTIAREITDVKAILNFAVRHKPPFIPYNPLQGYQGPKEHNVAVLPPTADETVRILKHASPHLIRAIVLAYYLGLRPGATELLSLTWSRFDPDGKILVSSAHKGGPEKRLVPVHENLLPLLIQWKESDGGEGPIIHYNGRPIRSMKTTWRKTLQRAGITRKLRPYDLRHHFITRVLEAGGDLKAVSEIVGSRPETIMRHYQHVTSELHLKTVMKIPPISIAPQTANHKKQSPLTIQNIVNKKVKPDLKKPG